MPSPAPRCDGSSECLATVHVHGCFAERPAAGSSVPDTSGEVNAAEVRTSEVAPSGRAASAALTVPNTGGQAEDEAYRMFCESETYDEFEAKVTGGIASDARGADAKSLIDALGDRPILFGLRAQGHLDAVRGMLGDGCSWTEIGRLIGWAPDAAKEFYERETAADAEAQSGTSGDSGAVPAPASGLPAVREPDEPSGVELIAAERERQIAGEGWTAEHDDAHEREEMVEAAVCYLLSDVPECRDDYWPWTAAWWKPTPGDRVRELVKAGALIAAEIDRLRRENP